MKRAIIVGSEGQDGTILYDRLRVDGWEILGIGRSRARSTSGRVAAVDITRRNEVADVVATWCPDTVFYLAAVHGSSEQSSDTPDDVLFQSSLAVNVQGLVNFLEVIPRRSALFYAASSHVFGKPDSAIQDESTPLRPDSIYGITKTAGVHACRYFREARDVRASVGILYNHESPLRRREFITRRVAESAVAISRGNQIELVLGDLNARVDWGYAPDYVDAMLRIALLPKGDDFIVATGETHSVQELVEIAFSTLNLDWRDHVRTDNSLLKRASRALAGNSTKVRETTGWTPTISFSEMVRMLVEAEGKRGDD